MSTIMLYKEFKSVTYIKEKLFIWNGTINGKLVYFSFSFSYERRYFCQKLGQLDRASFVKKSPRKKKLLYLHM